MRVVYDINIINNIQNCIILVKNEGWMNSNKIKQFYNTSPVDFVTVMSSSQDIMNYLGINYNIQLPVLVWKVNGVVKFITRKLSLDEFNTICNMAYKNINDNSFCSSLV